MNIQEIAIDQCIHFRGFRYGGFGNNIYEDYILGLENGSDVKKLREIFIGRVLAFTGTDFASILNIQLTQKYPPWIYPWSLNSLWKTEIKYFSPKDNPDIICHYSPDGVLASHINREFYWLERAHKAMLAGYKPKEFGYINVYCMKQKHQSRYLVLDGNHRLSAIHAIGAHTIKANVKYAPLCDLKFSKIWPGVAAKKYSHADAISIFNRYFLNENIVLPEEKNHPIILDEPLFLQPVI